MKVTPSRRTFLQGSASIAAGVALATQARSQAAPVPAADGFQVLRAMPAMAGPSGEPPIWGYEGAVPGPLLRIRQGQELKIRLANQLPAPTTVHWHGVRVPNGMDGVPALTQPVIATGASFDYRFRVPDAGTFWYHPPSTLSGQSERGLYGMLIVDEEALPEVDRDIPFVIDHRQLSQTISTKTNERLRLRFVSAAAGRITRLRFDRHAVWVMAIDGQPAEPFLAKEGRIVLAPGNRIDVFLDAVLEPGESALFFLDDHGREREFARLAYHPTEKRRAAQLPEPRPLAANPLPKRIDMRNALRIEIPFGGNASQAKPRTPGDSFSPLGSPLFSVKRGRAVVIAFPNATEAAYAVHIHGHHVRLLDQLDDGWKPFWLDTLMIDPGRTTRVAFVADNPGQWLVHGQPLGGSGAERAEWFVVT